MPAKQVYLETFGCQMNELDSELVAGQLRALGYRFVSNPDEAQVVLYNTCSVREQAEQKVWSRLGELKDRKSKEPELVVGVLGCMAERDGEDLIRRMPVVDILCGPGELDKLPALLDNAVRTRMSLVREHVDPESFPRWHDQRPASPADFSANQVALQGNSSRRGATLSAAQDTLELLDLSRAISPSDPFAAQGGAGIAIPRSAYVRITRGCNKFCTYCVVPFTRGAEVHRPPAHIVEECKKLADSGVVEVTLLGQTVNHYRFEHGSSITIAGVEQPQKGRSYAGGHRRDPFAGSNVTTFADLLRRIHDEAPGIERLRFVTSYPRDFGDDVLEVMRDHPRICRYLHVPVQSGSDRVLKAMNRGYTVAEYCEFLGRARAFLDEPEIGRPLMLSSDFIVGFPGETDGDFAQTLALVARARFKNSFIFKYSPRPGTTACGSLEDSVPERVKRLRNNTLLALQNSIALEIGREQVGKEFPVLVEGLSVRTLKHAGMTTGQVRAAGQFANQVAVTIRGKALDANGTDHGSHTKACAIASTMQDEPVKGESTTQLSCRTEGDQIVFINEPASRADALVGSIIPVRITSAEHLSLYGERVTLRAARASVWSAAT